MVDPPKSRTTAVISLGVAAAFAIIVYYIYGREASRSRPCSRRRRSALPRSRHLPGCPLSTRSASASSAHRRGNDHLPGCPLSTRSASASSAHQRGNNHLPGCPLSTRSSSTASIHERGDHHLYGCPLSTRTSSTSSVASAKATPAPKASAPKVSASAASSKASAKASKKSETKVTSKTVETKVTSKNIETKVTPTSSETAVTSSTLTSPVKVKSVKEISQTAPFPAGSNAADSKKAVPLSPIGTSPTSSVTITTTKTVTSYTRTSDGDALSDLTHGPDTATSTITSSSKKKPKKVKTPRGHRNVCDCRAFTGQAYLADADLEFDPTVSFTPSPMFIYPMQYERYNAIDLTKPVRNPRATVLAPAALKSSRAPGVENVLTAFRPILGSLVYAHKHAQLIKQLTNNYEFLE